MTVASSPRMVHMLLPIASVLMSLLVCHVLTSRSGAWLPPLMWVFPPAFFWLLFRPHTLPYIVLLVFGILQDVLLALPLGSCFLVLVLMRWLISFWQKRGGGDVPLLVAWIGFLPLTLICALAMSLVWAVARFGWDMGVAGQFVLGMLIMWGSYPLFHFGFRRLCDLVPTSPHE